MLYERNLTGMSRKVCRTVEVDSETVDTLSGRLCQLMTLLLSESLLATFRQRNKTSSAGAVVDDDELLTQVRLAVRGGRLK